MQNLNKTNLQSLVQSDEVRISEFHHFRRESSQDSHSYFIINIMKQEKVKLWPNLEQRTSEQNVSTGRKKSS